jgi:hypothetical protein
LESPSELTRYRGIIYTSISSELQTLELLVEAVLPSAGMCQYANWKTIYEYQLVRRCISVGALYSLTFLFLVLICFFIRVLANMFLVKKELIRHVTMVFTAMLMG